METITKIAWGLLILLHIVPAASVFAPALVDKLYGVAPTGDVGVLLVHRGALFLGVCITALYAIFDSDVRRLASLVVGVSVVGFLLVYLRAGLPAGELQKIAIPDAVGLVPLLWVSVQAWR